MSSKLNAQAVDSLTCGWKRGFRGTFTAAHYTHEQMRLRKGKERTGKNDDVYAILRLKVLLLLAYLLLLTNIKLTIYRIHQQTTTPPIHEHLAALEQQNSTVSKTTK